MCGERGSSSSAKRAGRDPDAREPSNELIRTAVHEVRAAVRVTQPQVHPVCQEAELGPAPASVATDRTGWLRHRDPLTVNGRLRRWGTPTRPGASRRPSFRAALRTGPRRPVTTSLRSLHAESVPIQPVTALHAFVSITSHDSHASCHIWPQRRSPNGCIARPRRRGQAPPWAGGKPPSGLHEFGWERGLGRSQVGAPCWGAPPLRGLCQLHEGARGPLHAGDEFLRALGRQVVTRPLDLKEARARQ